MNPLLDFIIKHLKKIKITTSVMLIIAGSYFLFNDKMVILGTTFLVIGYFSLLKK
jgi:hypothetical protein